MKILAENIRHLLKARDMTQGQLATRSGIPRPNINRIVNEAENVTLGRAEKIAKAFGISLSDLLDENLKNIVCGT